MNLGECEETVTVPTIIYKGRLKRRLNARYFCEIDVASKLAFVFRLKVKFLNFVSVDHHNTGFFRVGGIDKHFLSHGIRLRPAQRVAATRSLTRSGGPFV